MIRAKDDDMGRFSVEVELANYNDEVLADTGYLPRVKVRRTTISGVVDSGAARFVLPQHVVDELGLPAGGEVGVKYADGRKSTRKVAASAHLKFAGRGSVFDAVVKPRRKDALIGAIVLDALDLIVDCTQRKLIPRDSERPIAELE